MKPPGRGARTLKRARALTWKRRRRMQKPCGLMWAAEALQSQAAM